MTLLDTRPHLDIRPAVRELLSARRSGQVLAVLPDADQVTTEQDAYRIQDAVVAGLIDRDGPVTGWKVGSVTPAAEPFAAPLHRSTLFEGDTILPEGFCRHYGVEAEIVYRFGRDLLPRARSWSLDEVLDAVVSAHSAIEIIDTRFERPNSQPRLIHLADQASHGALIVGHGETEWRPMSPVTETVRLSFSDGRVVEHIGGNSAGDPRRLLVWLANHASSRGLPLLAGTMVTTGSMTDTCFVPVGTSATAQIAHLPPVTVRIA
ncbi:2-keto-4-pentenoate hydratase [Asaia krungthepensis]|uniref:2-oxopent-4-enoate hydratase n=1 Tax=Asaia krungthepensis NRIC 0535 TaxID=1307925 RepID=A0ABQ0PX98_9PROT|nr:2-keto-4-pentenoate hydratase [Asaia krungthepensis]GBQ83840.1 2-oxopent-4-enoate hydratase [Asaia krungthepensis NRIC 0535]